MPAEPTFATPRTPSRYTDGPAIAASSVRWLRRRPTSWQQDLLDVANEHVDGPDSAYAYDEVYAVVGRRGGKSILLFNQPHGRALAGPILLPNGRRLPFKAVHMAQNLTAARERFTKDLVLPYQGRFTEPQWERGVDYKRAAADTQLIIDPRRGRNRKDWRRAYRRRIASELHVLAPTAASARGDGLFHRGTDEALTLTLERGNQLRDAGSPTMAEMYGRAQWWWVSNVSVGTDERMWWWHARNRGRQSVQEDRRDGICYLEFSLPPGEDPDDEANWWRYYPALGDGIVRVQELRREREKLGRDAFAAEYLCRWPDENAAGVTGWEAFDENDWSTAGVDDELPEDTPLSLGVRTDVYGRTATIAAFTDAGGKEAGEIIDHRAGTDWARAALLELAGDVDGIVIDDRLGDGDLLNSLKGTAAEPKLVKVTLGDLSSACFALDAGIRQHSITWRRNIYHEALTAAAAAAQRTSGASWKYEERVSVSQTPILALALARHGLRHLPQPIADSQIF